MFRKRIQPRDQFFTNQLVGETVRAIIAESWKRSRLHNVDPLLSHAPKKSSPEELERVKRTSRISLSFERVKPYLDAFSPDKYAFALADETGQILELYAKGKLYERMCSANFAPGGMWSEEKVGTNAIGTSIAAQSPVIILDAEHYCEPWQPFSCAGVPILHPVHRTVVGTLDLTSLTEDFPENAILLTAMIAKQVEAEFRHQYQLECMMLEQHYAEKWLTFQEGILLAIDREGQIIRCSQPIHQLAASHLQRIDWEGSLENLASFPSGRWTEAPVPPSPGTDTSDPWIGKIWPVRYQGLEIGALVHLSIPSLPKTRWITHLPNPSRQQSRSSPPPTFTSFTPEQLAQLRSPVGQSRAWQELLQQATKVAPHDVTILLTGESGTGKEELAKYIHAHSRRHDKPFLAFNCATLNHELAASELFGYAAGSFTGGLKTGKAGLFEAANGGTLFLDEIGELPPRVQAMLLRVLQERQVMRIGEYQSRPVDVRIIAATNQDLEKAAQAGDFRFDLWYRINAVTLHLPPLRHRPEDIPLLAAYFLRDKQRNDGIPFTLAPETVHCLVHYPWPGNVRELKNVIEYAALFADSGRILPDHLPAALRATGPQPQDVPNGRSSQPMSDNQPVYHPPNEDHQSERERQHLLALLHETRYNISKAARQLGISRGTFYKRLKKYGIETRR